MAIELQFLIWSVVLLLAQLLIAILLAMAQVGLPTLAGNREDMPVLTGMAGRARRAHANMIESLLPFGLIVLTAVAAGKLNAMTALGVQLFFWGRLGFAAIYLVGLPWVRTLAWGVAAAGMVLVLLQLV